MSQKRPYAEKVRDISINKKSITHVYSTVTRYEKALYLPCSKWYSFRIRDFRNFDVCRYEKVGECKYFYKNTHFGLNFSIFYTLLDLFTIKSLFLLSFILREAERFHSVYRKYAKKKKRSVLFKNERNCHTLISYLFHLSFSFLSSMRIIIATLLAKPQMTSPRCLHCTRSYLLSLPTWLSWLTLLQLAAAFERLPAVFWDYIIIHCDVLQTNSRVIMVYCIEFMKWYVLKVKCKFACAMKCKGKNGVSVLWENMETLEFSETFFYIWKNQRILIEVYWKSI